jgi:8-oxo-dGTP pyrophosphatase MutT (NUDIX family)
MATPIPAATVILVRDLGHGLEVFLLKRHKKSSFMSNAFVFPGGKVDPDDAGAEMAAVRELFEEAGVLLVDAPFDAAVIAAERAALLASERDLAVILETATLRPDLTRLHPWSRWVTPSVEPKRFDTDFFVAELPPGQTPSFDQKETVEELWIAPADAIARQAAGELRLAPPQLRTMHELLGIGDLASLHAAAAARRATHRDMICPRIVQEERGLTILLPWDAGYAAAPGEGEPIPGDHPLAVPPSRMTWTGSFWEAS